MNQNKEPRLGLWSIKSQGLGIEVRFQRRLGESSGKSPTLSGLGGWVGKSEMKQVMVSGPCADLGLPPTPAP